MTHSKPTRRIDAVAMIRERWRRKAMFWFWMWLMVGLIPVAILTIAALMLMADGGRGSLGRMGFLTGVVGYLLIWPAAFVSGFSFIRMLYCLCKK